MAKGLTAKTLEKVLYVDRDGCLIVEPPVTEQVNNLSEVEFLPGVISSIKKFADAGYKIIMVTNQDGLGTPSNPREVYEEINECIFGAFRTAGVLFDDIFECPHFTDDGCECRKPDVGILGDEYLQHHKTKVDLEHSIMVGDRESDMRFAKNIGIEGFQLGNNESQYNWTQIAEKVLCAIKETRQQLSY